MSVLRLSIEGLLCDREEIVGPDPLRYFGFKVDLAKAYTLRSFFRMLENYPVLARVSPFLPSCIERYRAAHRSGCRCTEIECLELAKTVEMIGFPGNPRLEMYTSLFGLSGSERIDIREREMEKILDIPLRLGKLKHVVFGDRIDGMEFETAFNFFEFVDGIAWELSFQGIPSRCELRR